jgi:hypothetical protein
VDRDSSVGIVTRYGLEGPGIESPWGGGQIFRTRPDRFRGPPSLLYNGYRVVAGCKAAEAWRWPPTPSSTEVKERVELYLYSPFGLSWPVLGWPLPLPLPLPLLFFITVKINSKLKSSNNCPYTNGIYGTIFNSSPQKCSQLFMPIAPNLVRQNNHLFQIGTIQGQYEETDNGFRNLHS